VNTMRRISSGGPWEDAFAYSRAVVVGPFAYVSGCTSTVDGEVTHVGDAYEQTLEAFGVAEIALRQAGFSLSDAVRTRMFIVDIADGQSVGRAHKKLFDAVRPASTMVQVAGLIDSAMRVEVEVDAYRPDADPRSD
jgi:enamine deaminase RidA (YjgF/YER057c/UK114 family)